MSLPWKSERLGNVATLQRGFDLPHRLRKLGAIPIVTSSGVEHTHDEARVKGPGVVTGRYGTIGEVFFIRDDFWPLNTTLYVRDFHGNDPLFISYMLKRIDFHMHSGKSGVPGVNRNDLHEIVVAIPPTKAEQKAIAEALSDADILIDSLEQLIAKKRDVKQGAMQELLTGKKRLVSADSNIGKIQTEIGMLPDDWCVGILNDVCVKIQDGTHFSPEIRGGDYLYVTSRNIGFGVLDISDADRIDAAQHKAIYKRCDVKMGDILLTKDGANTGNAAMNTIAEEFSLLSSVAFLRFDPAKHIAAYFLQQILSSACQRRIQEAMAGNAITRLTLDKIRKLRFPLPPTKTEQEAIAKTLADMDFEIATLEAKLTKVRQVKQGMMQELLTGKKRLI